MNFNISLDQKGFWNNYFTLSNIKQKGDNRLTEAEITFVEKLITSDIDPFKGEGRKAIMEDLGYTNSSFSVYLKRIADKGIISKNGKGHKFHKSLIRIKDYLKDHTPESISFTFKVKYEE